MAHLPQRKIVVTKLAPAPEVYSIPVPTANSIYDLHPVTIRFEIKKIMMNKEFQDTLPEELRSRVAAIFVGCGCHSSSKISAIEPEIRSQIDDFYAKMNK